VNHLESRGVRYTSVALELPSDLSFEEWVGCVPEKPESQKDENTYHLQIMDWIRYGFDRWGELAIDEAVKRRGLAPSTCRNYVRVSRGVPATRRPEGTNLGFLQSIYKLSPAEQRAWQRKATENAWSQSYFTKAVRGGVTLTATELADATAAEEGLSLSSDDSVAVPGPEDDELAPVRSTEHTEIQWLLAKLGNDMGYDVWVARNDQNRQWNGNKFTALPHLLNQLPLQFHQKANETIQLIDILWLKRDVFVAAFEVERSTEIYSGILRMSDLVALVPNVNIRLFIAAPDARRNAVFREFKRPTFSALTPPLREVCKYISFTVLREHIDRAQPYLKAMTADFLDQFAEEV
jgi:hypothetical protein